MICTRGRPIEWNDPDLRFCKCDRYLPYLNVDDAESDGALLSKGANADLGGERAKVGDRKQSEASRKKESLANGCATV